MAAQQPEPDKKLHLPHLPQPHHAGTNAEKVVSFRLGRELAAAGVSMASVSAMLNPMDVVKVRLQTQNQLGCTKERMYKSFSHAAKRIAAEEGVAGLWRPGLVASIMRDSTYSSIRMGLYPQVKKIVSGGKSHENQTLLEMMAAAMITGAVGSGLANPTDLIKIRQQGEAGLIRDGVYTTGLWQGRAPSYSSAFAAFPAIVRQDGFAGLYKGVSATMVRAALLTAGQLASYDWSKRTLKQFDILDEGIALHLVGSIISGLCATTFAAPADIIKTRLMNDRATVGKHLYSGPIDCLIKTVSHDGVLSLFRGWVPSYLRLGPHFIISLPLYEQVRRLMGLEFF